MQFDQAPHECKAYSEAPCCKPGCRISLHEGIKNTRQVIWCDPDSRVANADDGLIARLFRGKKKVAGQVRVFRCIDEQVHEYLLQSVRIALQPYGHLWQRGDQAMLAGSDVRLDSF
jgi:hypothetical protein